MVAAKESCCTGLVIDAGASAVGNAAISVLHLAGSFDIFDCVDGVTIRTVNRAGNISVLMNGVHLRVCGPQSQSGSLFAWSTVVAVSISSGCKMPRHRDLSKKKVREAGSANSSICRSAPACAASQISETRAELERLLKQPLQKNIEHYV